MYKEIDYTQPGRMWFSQNRLAFMQEGYKKIDEAIAQLLGDKVVVSGVEEAGASVTEGLITYNNQVLPLVAGLAAPYVDLETIIQDVQFEDGTAKPVLKTKQLRLVSIATATSFPYADLVRPGQYKNVWLKNDTKDVLCDNAYITANFNVTTGVALPGSERAGWRIAFELGGRVKIGWSKFDTDPGDGVWDVKYNTMLKIGGEKLHQLIAEENAPHTHNYKRTRTDQVGTQYEANHMDGGGDRGLYTGDTIATSSSGNGDGHNNVQPYLVALTIVKI